MRTRCADGLRSPQAVHGAMGTDGTNWRVVDRHGGQTGRMGALDRLLSGLGGSRDVCGGRHPEQAQAYRLTSDLALDPEGVDG